MCPFLTGFNPTLLVHSNQLDIYEDNLLYIDNDYFDQMLDTTCPKERKLIPLPSVFVLIYSLQKWLIE